MVFDIHPSKNKSHGSLTGLSPTVQVPINSANSSVIESKVLTCRGIKNWVAVKELKLSYCIGETLFSYYIYPLW